MSSRHTVKKFQKGLRLRKIFVIFFSAPPKLRYDKAKFSDIIKAGEYLEF